MFVVLVPVKTSFFGLVVDGFVTSFVFESWFPSLTFAVFFSTSPLTSSLTLTLNLTVTLSSFATVCFHVTTPSASLPPFSADTKVVFAGTLSVIVAVTSAPVVFL